MLNDIFSSMRLLACVLLLFIGLNAEETGEAEIPEVGSIENQEPPQFEKEAGVYVLHDKDFDDFVKEHPTFLAKFYAPWLVFLCPNL